MTLTLYDVPPDVDASIGDRRPRRGRDDDAAGAERRLTFNGTRPRQVTVHVTGNRMGAVTRHAPRCERQRARDDHVRRPAASISRR